jgi:hypothetical protein
MPALRGRHRIVVLDRRVGARRALFLQLAQFGQLGFGLVRGLSWRCWHRDLGAGGEDPGLPLPHFRTIADDLAAGGECRRTKERQCHDDKPCRVPFQHEHDRSPFSMQNPFSSSRATPPDAVTASAELPVMAHPVGPERSISAPCRPLRALPPAAGGEEVRGRREHSNLP